MIGIFLDICGIVIGAVFPIFKTWRQLKTRRTRGLVPLAKYWVLFASLVTVEGIANIFSLLHIIPCYSFIKFMCILYITGFGGEHLYQQTISPILQKFEPKAAHLIILFRWIANIVFSNQSAPRDQAPKIGKTRNEESATADENDDEMEWDATPADVPSVPS